MVPTHLNWSCYLSNIIIAGLKETGAHLCSTKDKKKKWKNTLKLNQVFLSTPMPTYLEKKCGH